MQMGGSQAKFNLHEFFFLKYALHNIPCKYLN